MIYFWCLSYNKSLLLIDFMNIFFLFEDLNIVLITQAHIIFSKLIHETFVWFNNRPLQLDLFETIF
jgi:hypothetical protein